MATTNITQFSADVRAFADKIGVMPKIAQQKIAVDLWTQITERTPVLTGRARANWFLTQGAASTRVDLYPDAKTPGSVPVPAPPDASGVTGEESVFIVNNLPYIGALEDGHSQQAPNGMVRLSVQAMEARVNRALGEAKAEAGL